MLNKILDDTDLDFAKWAVDKLVTWKNETKLTNCLKIGGTKDKLMPSKDINNTMLIENGEHGMIVDMAEEVSKIINERIKKHLKKP